MCEGYDKSIENSSLLDSGLDNSDRSTNRHQWVLKFVATIGLSRCSIQYHPIVNTKSINAYQGFDEVDTILCLNLEDISHD